MDRSKSNSNGRGRGIRGRTTPRYGGTPRYWPVTSAPQVIALLVATALQLVLLEVHQRHENAGPPFKAEIHFSEESKPEEVEIHVDLSAEQAAEAVEELVEEFSARV